MTGPVMLWQFEYSWVLLESGDSVLVGGDFSGHDGRFLMGTLLQGLPHFEMNTSLPGHSIRGVEEAEPDSWDPPEVYPPLVDWMADYAGQSKS